MLLLALITAPPSFADEPQALLFGYPVERHETVNVQHDFPLTDTGNSRVSKRKTPGSAPAIEAIGGNAGIRSSVGTWIQSGHTGAWYNSDQDGHGLFVEVLADSTAPSGMRLLVSWYAYLDGQQVWILAIGPVVEEGAMHVAELDAWIFSGADFPPLFNQNRVVQEFWGTMRLLFNGCMEAELEWATGYSGFTSGQLRLERLSSILDSTCDPALGGDANADDHGDSWQLSTGLSSGDEVSGNIETEGDVDVFTFSVNSSNSSIKVYTTGSTDTMGELFELLDGVEQSLQSDDNSGSENNFLIERDVDSGQYSVHVKASAGTGPYSIWLEIGTREEQIEIVFDNKLLRNIQVYKNGVLIGVVQPSSKFGQFFAIKTGDRFSWTIQQDFGDDMGGQYQRINDLETPEITYEVDNVIGNARFFIPSLDNSTSTGKLLGVNMELGAENRCNCVIPSGASDVLVGYFALFDNSNCRFYEEQSGYSGDFLSWDNFSDNVQQETGLVSFVIE